MLRLRTLGAVLGTSLASFADTGGIQGATYGMVTNSRQVLYSTTPDKNHGMFLQIMAFATNVGGNLKAIGQANAGNFAQSRVWFLRCGGIDTRANTSLLRAGLERRYSAFDTLLFPTFSNELINRCHAKTGSFIPDYFSH